MATFPPTTLFISLVIHSLPTMSRGRSLHPPLPRLHRYFAILGISFASSYADIKPQHNHLYSFWVLLHRDEEAAPRMCQDTKSILHDTSCPRQTVVEYPLLVALSSVRERLPQPSPHRKCVVPYNEVRDRSVIPWQWFRFWKPKGVSFQRGP